LSDEKFDRLAFGSGQNRSPRRAEQSRICRRLLLGCCVDAQIDAKQSLYGPAAERK
jgi:hypothetical protein